MFTKILRPTTFQSPISLRTTAVHILLVLIGAFPCNSSTNSARDAYLKVKTNLLSHPYAVDKIPPKVALTDHIYVSLSFFPIQVLSVNEVEMTVTVSATLLVGWEEPAFAWDPTNNSIFAISVPKNDIWNPVLMNILSIDSDDLIIEFPQSLRIEHTGNVRTVNMYTLTVSCTFDMEWFPFDTQRCSFPFVPFNAEGPNINTVSVHGPQFYVGYNGSNSDWIWEEVNPRQVYTTADTGQGIVKNFTYVSFEVVMKRQSTIFYLTNIIFPMSATAILTVGVFLIPAASGEKISYLISIFISTTVFLSSLSNTMSKGQGNICRFNAFIVAITVKIILATAASMFVLHRYQQEQEQEQEKEADVTPSISAKTKNGNSIYLADTISDNRRRKLSSADADNNHSVETTATISKCERSLDLPYVKLDAFERSELALTAYTEQVTGSKRRKLKISRSDIRRFWTRGYCMTSTELDRMFLILFVVFANFVIIIIMRA